jgi:hypothetical protein
MTYYHYTILLILLTSGNLASGKEEIMYCDETADCIEFNPYFECKPIQTKTVIADQVNSNITEV